MPRYCFHILAGENRTHLDRTGWDLPNPAAVRESAGRIARQLLAWNLEPVQWLDCLIQVTDEVGAIVFELPFTEARELVSSS
jgi:hypothetical protein